MRVSPCCKRRAPAGKRERSRQLYRREAIGWLLLERGRRGKLLERRRQLVHGLCELVACQRAVHRCAVCRGAFTGCSPELLCHHELLAVRGRSGCRQQGGCRGGSGGRKVSGRGAGRGPRRLDTRHNTTAKTRMPALEVIHKQRASLEVLHVREVLRVECHDTLSIVCLQFAALEPSPAELACVRSPRREVVGNLLPSHVLGLFEVHQ